jgi:hypothetical protein
MTPVPLPGLKTLRLYRIDRPDPAAKDLGSKFGAYQ